MPRWLKGLFVAFVALGLAVAVARRPRHEKPLPIPALPNNPAKLEIHRPDAKLSFEKAGGVWRMKSPADYPANAGAVQRTLEGLGRISAEAALTDRAESHRTYLVDDSSGIAVSVTGEGGEARWIFGKEAPDFAHLYLRVPGNPSVYLAAGLARSDLAEPAAAWRENRLFPAAAGARIARAVLVDGKNAFEFRRSSDSWIVNGATLPAVNVDWFIQRIADARASGFIDPPEAADLKRFGLSGAGAGRFEVEFDSGPVFRCVFGKKEENGWPLRRNDEPVLLRFDARDRQNLLDGALEISKGAVKS